MKTRTLQLIVVGLTAFLGVTLSRDASANKSPAGDATDHQFQMMDTNGDGKVSREEHAAGARKMFETMDANGDGKVTAAEMDAAHEKIAGAKARSGDMTAADKIKVIDTDHDGALSAEEHAAGSETMFDKMDTSKDGFLTKSELAAGHARMMRKTTTAK